MRGPVTSRSSRRAARFSQKTKGNFTRNHPKSLLPGLAAHPVVITSENFNTPAMRAVMDDPAAVKLYVFTVQSLLKPNDEGRPAHAQVPGRPRTGLLRAAERLGRPRGLRRRASCVRCPKVLGRGARPVAARLDRSHGDADPEDEGADHLQVSLGLRLSPSSM